MVGLDAFDHFFWCCGIFKIFLVLIGFQLAQILFDKVVTFGRVGCWKLGAIQL